MKVISGAIPRLMRKVSPVIINPIPADMGSSSRASIPSALLFLANDIIRMVHSIDIAIQKNSITAPSTIFIVI